MVSSIRPSIADKERAKLVEDRLSFSLLAPDQSLDNLDQLHFKSWPSLNQPHGFSLSFLVTSPDVVFGQLDGIGIALRLTGF